MIQTNNKASGVLHTGDSSATKSTKHAEKDKRVDNGEGASIDSLENTGTSEFSKKDQVIHLCASKGNAINKKQGNCGMAVVKRGKDTFAVLGKNNDGRKKAKVEEPRYHASGTLWSADWTVHVQPDAETALWDSMLKDFVLRGLFREFKISFCEYKDVLNLNSPVFQRVKMHFQIGQKNPWECVDLDSKPEWKVKGWWYHGKSGGKLLLSKLANKRGNTFHAIKNTMKGEQLN